jgi:hypothetical protein
MWENVCRSFLLSFCVESTGIPGQVRVWMAGKLHAIRVVAVSCAMWEPAWRGGAVGRMVGSRIVRAAWGSLRAVGIIPWTCACGATDSLTAARVVASGDRRVRRRGGSGLALLASVRVRVLLLCASRSVWRVRHHVVSRRLPAKQTRHCAASF